MENVPDLIGIKYDKYCLCYGTYTRWLYILFPCSIVDCVIIHNFFWGNCDISNLTRIKAIKLLDTIHIKWYVFIHFTKSLNILPTFAINVSSNTRTS